MNNYNELAEALASVDSSINKEYSNMSGNIQMGDILLRLTEVLDNMRQNGNNTSIKPEIATYDGTRKPEKVLAFLSALDNAFELKNMHEDHLKTLYFGRHLTGHAQLWWASVHNEVIDTPYDYLVQRFKDDFLDANYMVTVKKKLFSLRQIGSVASYVTFFRELRRQLENDYASEQFYKDIFINGLAPAVQTQVKALTPDTVDQAIRISLEIGSVIGGNNQGGRRNNSQGNNGNRTIRNSNYFGPAAMDVDQVEVDEVNTNEDSSAARWKNVKCFHCKNKGHIKKNCPERLKDNGQSL